MSKDASRLEKFSDQEIDIMYHALCDAHSEMRSDDEDWGPFSRLFKEVRGHLNIRAHNRHLHLKRPVAL